MHDIRMILTQCIPLVSTWLTTTSWLLFGHILMEMVKQCKKQPRLKWKRANSQAKGIFIFLSEPFRIRCFSCMFWMHLLWLLSLLLLQHSRVLYNIVLLLNTYVTYTKLHVFLVSVCRNNVYLNDIPLWKLIDQFHRSLGKKEDALKIEVHSVKSGE